MPHTAFAYLHPIPDADLRVQRLAVEAMCAAQRLGEPRPYVDLERREAFAALLAEVERGAVVAVPTLAVLGEDVLERAGRALALLAAGADLRLADGLAPLAALRRDWSAGDDSTRRRHRAREGMRRRALRGQVLGRPPYGYAVEAGTLVPHPREAPVVRGMFERYLDRGDGVRVIAAALNASGIRTRRGGMWSAGSVRAVLRNPVYTGLYRRLGVAVPRAHDALVPLARFDEAARRMADRRTAPSKQRREPYLLAGLAHCGACGGQMIGARRPGEGPEGGVHRYYRCASRTNQGRCEYRTWRAEDLEAEVRRVLATELPLHIAPPPAVEPTSGTRRERLGRLLARMLERWTGGEWTDDDLLRRSRATALALARLDAAEGPALPPGEARGRLAGDWDALAQDERRALLVAAVAFVTVRDEGIEVALRA